MQPLWFLGPLVTLGPDIPQSESLLMDTRRRTTTSTRITKPQAAAQRSTTSWILRHRDNRPETPLPGSPHVAQSYAGQLPAAILERLVHDPLFQLLSSDRSHWICPYTGRAVPATDGRIPAARTYLEHSAVWRSMEPLPAKRLHMERWRHDLSQTLGHEPRLRLFSRQGRGWLNPYDGKLAVDVNLEDGQLTPKTIIQMAEILAASPAANSHPMLPQDELLQLYHRTAAAAEASAEAIYRAESSDTSEVVWIGEVGTDNVRKNAAATAARVGTEDLSQAQRVQQRLLTELPTVPGVTLGVHFAPRSSVGGDFYHVERLNEDQLLLAVGDVSGHGVQAALVAATALKTLRFVLRGGATPLDIVLACNDELREDLLPGQFISLFLAVIDTSDNTVTAICAGHHPALLVNLAREFPVQRVGRPGMALGLGNRDTLTRMLKPVTLTLQTGDLLVQATDGLIETTDHADQPWGEGSWMASVIARSVRDQAQTLADGLVADLRASIQRPVDDDLTVLVAAFAGLPSDSPTEMHDKEIV